MSAADETAILALSTAGAFCGECGFEPGDRGCPDCERCWAWYVKALRAAGWAPRTEVTAEFVAWLVKRAREHRAKGPQYAKQADVIGMLASKVQRGAVRPNNLLSLPPQGGPEDMVELRARVAELEARPSPAAALRQVADQWAAHCPEHSVSDDVWMDCPQDWVFELRRAADERDKGGA